MKHFIGLILSLMIAIMAIDNVSANQIPYDQISFFGIPNENSLIGYYFIERQNLGETWEEWDSFEENFLSSFISPKVCFGYFTHNNKASFYSKEGYEWEECNDWGRTCLCLKKE